MEKKKRNYFKGIMWCLILLFFAVYIFGSSGYSEKITYENTVLTKEAINEFEEDVLNGEILDLNTYIEVDTKDYSNTFTNIGENLNDAILLIVTDGFSEITNIFKYLLT